MIFRELKVWKFCLLANTGLVDECGSLRDVCVDFLIHSGIRCSQMHKPIFSCLFFVLSLLSGFVFSDDSPAEAFNQALASSSVNPVPEAVPPAENVDLKEVVVDALLPSATIVPTPTELAPSPSPEVQTDPAAEQAAAAPAAVDSGAVPATSPAASPAAVAMVPTQPSLFLLDREVLPGTSARLEWASSVPFMGISVHTAVLVLNGVNPGPTLCLTAAVHGDELNGIEIVRRVLFNIDPKTLSGAVIGVPIVNLQGFRRSSRYLTDRRDLNRFFPGNEHGSSASRIAYSFFNEVVTHCDKLVDLHTASFRRTNLPQLRADLKNPEVAKLAKKMGAIVVVHSEGEEGSLRRAATEHGIPALTLEAGAPHELEKSAVEHGVKSIESALDGLGMLKRRRFWERPVEPVFYQSSWVRAKDGGILISEVKLGDTIKAGDVLGLITDPVSNQRSEIRAPYDGRVIGMALNQVMYPGFAAYHIGLQSSVEEAAQGESSEEMDSSPDVDISDPAADMLDPQAKKALEAVPLTTTN